MALLILPADAGRGLWFWTLAVVGVMLTLAGESLRLWSVRHIGVISRTRSDRLGPLISTGPFALVRNPLYLGNLLIWTGFTLTAGLPWLAPIVLVLLALIYRAIVAWEEALLESRHGAAYRAYAARVHRWIPRGREGQESREGQDLQPWTEVLFSERGTLIAVAAGYILLSLKLSF